MGVLTVVLYALVVVIALMLIGLILLQPSKSGGLGAAFGGVGESVFGAQAGSHLTKATVVLTAIFFICTLLLATLIGHGVRGGGDGLKGIDRALKQDAAAAPAAAAPAAVETAAPAAEAVPAAPVTEAAPAK